MTTRAQSSQEFSDPQSISSATGNSPESVAELQVFAVYGLPEIRPGDDLASLIATATASLVRSGDIVVVTSKVVSKAEGQLVTAPTDPTAHEILRRELIDQETVRLIAQKGRTKIVENHWGLVAAAAGVDASNVHKDEIALLPRNPDASASALVAEFAKRGLTVGVIITDTQGRAWREGVTDVAIGAANIAVFDDHRGESDQFGNRLVVTQVALADEISAATDLVKGKLRNIPVAIVRGLADLVAPDGDTPTRGRDLMRPAAEDLFRLGTDLAIEWGRRDAQGEVPPGHDALHTDTRSLLTAWTPPSTPTVAYQEALRQSFLTLLALRGDATSRSCAAGHVTASTVVLSADLSETLLTLHPRVGKWVQLGGHCEGDDATLAGAAAREAREESGIADLVMSRQPVHLDIHPITCSLGVATRHFDVRFVAVAPPGAIPHISAESDDLRFWPVNALPDGIDEPLRDAITAAVVTARNEQ